MARTLLLSLALVCVCSGALGFSIPSIYARGSHYEIGYAIGSSFQARFQSFLAHYDAMDSLLLPFYNSTVGRQVVDAFESANRKQYPEYFEELQGISDGSGVDFLKVMLLNFREELFLIMQNTSSTFLATPSCSDILVHTPTRAFFGHNEDGDLTIAAGAIFQQTTLTDDGQAAYSAYTYPLLLAGNAFSTNQHGLAISVNALFPKDILVGGLARQFITRDVLNAVSIEDAIRRVTEAGPCASGFSLNVGSVVTKEIFNIEMSPGIGQSSVLRVTNYSYHFNQYLRLNVSHFEDPSSDHRLARVQQLPTPQTPQQVLDILGDTADKAYPIYRTGVAPDLDADTMASALFDLDAARVDVYVLQNPKNASAPLMRLPIGPF